MNDLAILARLTENLIRLGTIAIVKMKHPRVQVNTGTLTTGWLPWVAGRAGADHEWNLRGKQGRVKRKGQMFHELRVFMTIRGDGNAVSVGLAGRVAFIGRVHQFGLKDRTKPGTPEIRHEQRAILGFSKINLNLIRASFIAFLARNLFLKRETVKNIICQPINICITMNPS